MRKKKTGWGMVLGAIFLIIACIVAFNMTKLPEKNVYFPVIHTPSA
ncbi:hypothetical protein ICN41_02745 [Polynucleobacter sp. 15G-AUS-farblos]|nr:hypothetical protein [Polynucleobacter sp. 15G-AUS-farblos]MBU3582902.1 hypothetical protein [Polynucleobacter sp. 15G-AUS-farblos]